MEGEETGPNKLLIFVIIGAVAIAVVLWFVLGRSPATVTPPPPPATPQVENITLPPDLRILSGKVTGKTASLLTVEWVIYARTDLSGKKVYTKRISWNDRTIFERSQIGVAASPEKIKLSDIKVGQAVLVTAVQPVQSSDDLAAERVQVVLPPSFGK